MSKKPGKRRDAREAAIQFLFSRDLNADTAPDPEQLNAYWELRPLHTATREFCRDLIIGAIERLPEIDRCIREALENYAFERIGIVERNILRVAAFELLYRDDIPDPVAINEAIEIARRFGGDESAAFVNGILDRIRRSARC